MASFIKSFFSPARSDNAQSAQQPQSPPTRSPQSEKSQNAATYDALNKDSILASATVKFSLMRADRTLDVKAASAQLVLCKRPQPYEYDVQVYIDNQQKLRELISSKLPTWFDAADHSIQFSMSVGSTVLLWHLQFSDAQAEQNVKWTWQRCIAEQARQEAFDKVYDTKKDITNQWIGAAYTNDTDMTVDADDSDVPDSNAYSYTDKQPSKPRGQYIEFLSPVQRTAAALSDSDSDSSDSDSDSSDDDAPAASKFSRGGTQLKPRHSHKKEQNKNQNLAVGMAQNRTFVSRGQALGVFRNDDNGELEYVNKIDALKTLSGDVLQSPNKLMLTNADNKMLLLSGDNRGVVYEMDMNRGQIINEYKNKNNDDFVIRGIGQTSKYAELENEPLFSGVNRNTVFTMDTRSADIAQIKTYATPYGLNTIAADDSGNTVVGDDKGMLRFYNDISKNAKTLLPGLGDGVIGIDVTRDGKHVLVTTQHYLLLVPTTSGDVNGFTKSITNTAQPPIKLQLDPTDILRYSISELAFTPAHFDIGSGVHDEKWIVTSTGPYIITWNLKRVLRGKKYDYKIKKTTGNVVADQFIYNKDKQVAVALPDDVYIESRSSRL